MFSMVDIGERAGSGYDVLCEGTMSAGRPDPTYAEIYEPDRVRLTMELETSVLVEFRLPGMGARVRRSSRKSSRRVVAKMSEMPI